MNRQNDGYDDYNSSLLSILYNYIEGYIANFIKTVKAGAHNHVYQKAEYSTFPLSS